MMNMNETGNQDAPVCRHTGLLLLQLPIVSTCQQCRLPVKSKQCQNEHTEWEVKHRLYNSIVVESYCIVWTSELSDHQLKEIMLHDGGHWVSKLSGKNCSVMGTLGIHAPAARQQAADSAVTRAAWCAHKPRS